MRYVAFSVFSLLSLTVKRHLALPVMTRRLAVAVHFVLNELQAFFPLRIGERDRVLLVWNESSESPFFQASRPCFRISRAFAGSAVEGFGPWRQPAGQQGEQQENRRGELY